MKKSDTNLYHIGILMLEYWSKRGMGNRYWYAELGLTTA
jgi:hypothetical protein